jgi:hypothetical protein
MQVPKFAQKRQFYIQTNKPRIAEICSKTAGADKILESSYIYNTHRTKKLSVVIPKAKGNWLRLLVRASQVELASSHDDLKVIGISLEEVFEVINDLRCPLGQRCP